MRTAFYLDVTAVVLALLAACVGLSQLPVTGPLLTATPDGDFGLRTGPLVSALVALAAALWFARRALGRPLNLPSIPGLPARTAGLICVLLAATGALTLFWWLAAGEPNLPVGIVGWVVGIIALFALTWAAVAGGALWLGRGTEKEREAAELSGDTPIGLA
jgi:hypothetical protein